jgi:hypothetical protein
MANPRTVINPFTKNEQRMRRNTRGTKWVTAGLSMVLKESFDTSQQSKQYNSERIDPHIGFDTKPTDTGTPSSMTDETKPTPSKLYTARPHISHRDSLASLPKPIDFSKLEQTWKESDATIPLHSSVLTGWPELKTKRKEDLGELSGTDQTKPLDKKRDQQQAASSSSHWYRTAKEIYTAGPKGEGQKIWEAYQQALSHRKAGEELVQITPSEPIVRVKVERQLPLPLPTSPDGVLFPPLRPRSVQLWSGIEGKETGREHLRGDSGFSSTSCETPIVIDRTVRSTIDANQSLPPAPRLDAVPKVRKAQDESSESNRHHSEKDETHHWWQHSPSRVPQSPKSKISHPGPLMAPIKGTSVNIVAECGGIGGPAAAMSLPVTRTGAPIPRASATPEKIKEVNRPSPRSFHLPTFHLSPSKSKRNGSKKVKMDENDDPHSTHWRDRLVGPACEAGKSLKQTAMETLDSVHAGRKKRPSDVSFACQGNVDDRLDRYQVSRWSSSDDEMDLVPDPLFSGKRMGRDDESR